MEILLSDAFKAHTEQCSVTPLEHGEDVTRQTGVTCWEGQSVHKAPKPVTVPCLWGGGPGAMETLVRQSFPLYFLRLWKLKTCELITRPGTTISKNFLYEDLLLTSLLHVTSLHSTFWCDPLFSFLVMY